MKYLKKWIMLQVDLDSFHARGAVYAFALKMTFRAVILAFLLNIVALPMFYWIGLTSMPVAEAILLSVAFSWLFGGAISGALAYVMGQVIRDLSLSRAEFRRLSRTDTLSGLLNRRAFAEALENAGTSASLAIFDLDRFKMINDSHGHSAGDEVIKTVSRAITTVFQAPHTVARLGGEEFGVIIQNSTSDNRLMQVEILRQVVEQQVMTVNGAALRTTISAGVAEFCPGRGADEVYSLADRALYLAKALGRNRVVHEREIPERMSQTRPATDLSPATDAA
ncbi:GGDEF domain-containing protein [Rhizobium sp. RU36D]|uniref:GGDEF domain-containing protein n=1 Tax=Rhizobium sp. RU36D TaxID=1907415 RepID=UPI0009D89A36|nr:GGDEF domain-containing protein [Rhizobium sp. RU36D]SMC39605.1 diguanylate cyclase (GGDEF) domain-containing protein [Rhizobium sp. RU36D]